MRSNGTVISRARGAHREHVDLVLRGVERGALREAGGRRRGGGGAQRASHAARRVPRPQLREVLLVALPRQDVQAPVNLPIDLIKLLIKHPKDTLAALTTSHDTS